MMSRRKPIPSPIAIETIDHVRLSERVELHRGDAIRVRGGPVYQLANGEQRSMGYRGKFRFVAYYPADKCIVAAGDGGNVVIPIGDWSQSIDLDRYQVRPYRISKTRTRKGRR